MLRLIDYSYSALAVRPRIAAQSPTKYLISRNLVRAFCNVFLSVGGMVWLYKIRVMVSLSEGEENQFLDAHACKDIFLECFLEFGSEIYSLRSKLQ